MKITALITEDPTAMPTAPPLDDPQWQQITNETIREYTIESILTVYDTRVPSTPRQIQDLILTYLLKKADEKLKLVLGRAYESETGLLATDTFVDAILDPTATRGAGLRQFFFNTIRYIAAAAARKNSTRTSNHFPFEDSDQEIAAVGYDIDEAVLRLDVERHIRQIHDGLSEQDIQERIKTFDLRMQGETIDNIACSLKHSPTTIKKWLDELKPFLIALLGDQNDEHDPRDM